MADDENRVEQWVRVPDKSTLTITVTGTTETESVLGTVDGLVSDNTTILEQLDTLKGTPFALLIEKGKRYSVDILLGYRTDATASVLAKIITQNGDQFGDAFKKDLKGKADAEEFVSLFVFAVKKT